MGLKLQGSQHGQRVEALMDLTLSFMGVDVTRYMELPLHWFCVYIVGLPSPFDLSSYIAGKQEWLQFLWVA